MPVQQRDSARDKPSAPSSNTQRARQKGQTDKPSQVQSIVDAVVVKDDEIFFLCAHDGQVPLSRHHGLGLYYHDCRYLDGYELRLKKTSPEVLGRLPERDFTATLEFTNRPFRDDNGRDVAREEVGFRWQRTLDASSLGLYDRIRMTNYGLDEMRFTLALTFSARFEDLFVIRGRRGFKLGTPRPPRWQDGVLHLLYDGSDGLCRGTSIHFDPTPTANDGPSALFDLTLPPRGRHELRVTVLLAEDENVNTVQRQLNQRPDFGKVDERDPRSEAPRKGWAHVGSDNPFPQNVIDRAFRDLRLLRTNRNKEEFFAAGIPWYVTLFGRDTLITSLQMLAYRPEIAAQTLRLLATYQGAKEDQWRAEQPGKMPHELRVGELARKGAIPFTPYYGTVDATPLFLLVLAGHAEWTADLGLFHELRGNVERALEWLARQIDEGNGYLQYQGKAKNGLSNQGWKDSGDAIVNKDGSLARPPIALVEVQGYVWAAWLGLADLYERAGDSDRARQLRDEAAQLRQRFNHDFWMSEERFYALALQDGKEPVAVISSNPGQALWTGIIDADRAGMVADRLLQDDLFSGWGVRTLSTRERRFNPIGYHLGTVWPHDNSLLAAGLRRSGQLDGLRRIVSGILTAASHFPAQRIPEVFAGFSREEFDIPIRYPVACHPQAWAAGAVAFLLQSALGLVPKAFEQKLHIVRPILPDSVTWIELRGVRVGQGQADLRFTRSGDGEARVEVLGTAGSLEVVVEPNRRTEP